MKILVMASTLLVTLTTLGWYGESQQCIELRQAVENNVLSVDDTYQLAGCEAVAGNHDSAFVYLNQLQQKGFNDADWLLADVKFESLHLDGRWHVLLNEVSSTQQLLLADTYAENLE